MNSAHWVFNGTGLRDGDVFGAASLHERCHGGASGHETDKRSPHSPANTQFLAKGLNALFVSFGIDLPQTGLVFKTRTIIVSLVVGVLVTLIAVVLPLQLTVVVSAKVATAVINLVIGLAIAAMIANVAANAPAPSAVETARLMAAA